MSTSKPHINKSASMTNIGDEPITIQISGGGPGSGINETTVKPGESAPFPEPYCVPVPGAGPAAVPSIIARKSTRTWADGVRRPALVPAADAKKIKAVYDAAVDAWRKKIAADKAPASGATK